MAPQKETIMVLKVDLDCPRCYKKVKRLLCQFHQIHDQVYNEKQNTVMIKVVCCSPEKIRDRLCCKGGKSIKSIEILQPKKPPPPLPPPAEKPPPEKPDEPAPPQPPPPVEKPPPPPPPPAESTPPPPADPNPNPPEKLKKNGSKNGSRKNGPPQPEKPPEEVPPPPPTKPNNPEPTPEPNPDPPPQKPAEPDPTPVQWNPVYQVNVNPVNMCCPECYAGHTTGPCYHGYGYGSYGYGVPPPPPPAGGWGYYGGGYSGYNNNYKPGYCVSRCGDCISDENPTACVIM
ncbi:hypothetical protein V2J09_012312 [Rumex salicifolius]